MAGPLSYVHGEQTLTLLGSCINLLAARTDNQTQSLGARKSIIDNNLPQAISNMTAASNGLLTVIACCNAVNGNAANLP
jgi:hypothetical protein